MRDDMPAGGRGEPFKLGSLVRFWSERDGGPVHRVTAVASDGMVLLNDMGGWFAPHLFAFADDIADIPPMTQPDAPAPEHSPTPCYAAQARHHAIDLAQCSILAGNSAIERCMAEAARVLAHMSNAYEANQQTIAALVEALHNARVLLSALTGPDDEIAQATIRAADAALALARKAVP